LTKTVEFVLIMPLQPKAGLSWGSLAAGEPKFPETGWGAWLAATLAKVTFMAQPVS
jgi:hypothetical protein